MKRRRILTPTFHSSMLGRVGLFSKTLEQFWPDTFPDAINNSCRFQR